MANEQRDVNVVSIVGVGKLGFSMAVAFAKRGFKVICVDTSPAVVRKINAGRAPILETGVQSLLTKYRRRITATLDAGEAVKNSDMTLVVVATPSSRNGKFSNRYLLPAIRSLGKGIREKSAYHIVSVSCTTMPGTTSDIIAPLLEKTSGRTCGSGFGLVYNPEFIALGSVVNDFLNPDFVLVGESDERVGKTVESVYARLCENGATVARMTPTEAEIAKISLNCFCTMKISFANMLAEMAEKLPGVDAAIITDAIGMDARIGTKYLSPGLGFGGPCFPRDNVAFRAFASEIGVNVPIPEAVHATNERQPVRVVAVANRLLPHGGRIAVLGLSYKPETHIVERSHALRIALLLSRNKRHRVSVYDPSAMVAARAELKNNVQYAKCVDDCLEDSDLCILATPWSEFRKLTASRLKRIMRAPRIIDCCRCLDIGNSRGIEYMAIGAALG